VTDLRQRAIRHGHHDHIAPGRRLLRRANLGVGPKLRRQFLDGPQIAGRQHHLIAGFSPKLGERPANPAGADEADLGFGGLGHQRARRGDKARDTNDQKRSACQHRLDFINHLFLAR
jgi:hypothetical protein